MAQPKVALVTGSGKRRIGATVAKALAERGYTIALHYRTSQEEAREGVAELEAAGTRAVAFQADLTDEDATQRMMEGVLERFGRIDVLVNCAAIWVQRSLEEVRASDVREHFETNVLGTFLCSRLAGLAMVPQAQGGCIITFGDWADARPYLNYAAYFASKGAVPGLTRCLAVELAMRNPRIRVNCILPGPVMLPDDMSDDERREAISGTLLKREGSPENIAQAVLYLVENDFVTGDCLRVDGGRTVHR